MPSALSIEFLSSDRRSSTGDAFLFAWSHDAFVSNTGYPTCGGVQLMGALRVTTGRVIGNTKRTHP